MPTAALLIIGNEILSGRTPDINLPWLAEKLNELGIRVMELRGVLDVEKDIADAVNALRARYDYVFTTGGIGPTHDDITTASVAKAFGVPVIRHPDAEAALRTHYTPEQINAARLKMADVPRGATLIDNHVTAAPGYRMGNVYVLAGVPRIMQAMFDGCKHTLQGGAPMRSQSLSAYITEGTIAAELAEIQNRFAQVEIGSYPFAKDGKLGTTIICRSTEESAMNAAAEEVKALLSIHGAFDL